MIILRLLLGRRAPARYTLLWWIANAAEPAAILAGLIYQGSADWYSTIGEQLDGGIDAARPKGHLCLTQGQLDSCQRSEHHGFVEVAHVTNPEHTPV